jgi:hypothetical protein
VKRFKEFAAYAAAFALVALGCSIGANAQQDVISTIAGRGPNALPGTISNINEPYTLAMDSAGNIYFSAEAQNKIFKLSTSGTVTLIAGTGFAGYNGDNIPATTAELYSPTGIAVDTASPANVYFSDFNNCEVRKIDQATGVISIVAGVIIHPTTGSPYPQCGSTIGSKADATNLNGPQDVAWDPSTGNLYITDYYNGRLLEVAGSLPTGAVTQVAGSGGSTTSTANCGGSSPYGAGGPAADSYICYPQAVTVDTSVKPSNVFLTESNSGGHCDILEIVGATKKIYQVAGNYSCGYTDGVKATSAQLNDPWQVTVSVKSGTSTVTVADYYNNRIRQFPLTYSSNVPVPGTITTIAGKGGGFCGDGGGALDACMDPVGLAFDSSGNTYIGDYGNDRIRKITKSTGDISTIVGWGPNGGTTPYYSDPIGIPGGITGNDISLYFPYGVYADPNSTHVFIAGYDGYSVYRMNSATLGIAQIAGNGAGGFVGDGTIATGSGVELNQPTATVLDHSGNLYISDQSNCVIREVEASNGFITTIAGGSPGSENGCGFSGNGGPATKAQLSYPEGLAIDSADNLYIGEYYNCDVRKVNLSTHVITTVAGDPTLGCGYSGDGGPATAAELRNVLGVAVDGAGNLYISAANDQRVRKVTAATGIITTFAGTGVGGYSGDGFAPGVTLYNPQEITSDVNGNVFIADESNQLIRWVEPGGQLITIAGTPPYVSGYAGDGGVATKALLYNPTSVARDSAGNTYIADYQNGVIREITAFAGYGRSTNSLTFETQPSGTTSDFQPITISAVGPVTISGITATTGFSEVDDCVGVALVAGETCEIDVYFSPTAPEAYNGSLTISSDAFFAANGNKITLSGTGGGLSVTGSLAFPVELIGSKTVQTVTLHTGAALTIKSIALSTTGNYAITGGSCPLTGGSLAAGGSCTVAVTFEPGSDGFKKNTLVFNTNDPASPLLVPATGTGTQVELSATSIAYGTVPDRNTVTKDITITNTGTTSLTVSSALSGSGAAQYAVVTTSANTCRSAVAAGKSCTLPVIFNPTSLGTFDASVTLTTNGGYNPVIALSGTSEADASLSTTSIAFGTIKHGTTKTTDITITNLGTDTLTVSTAFSGSGASSYKIGSGSTCGSPIAGGGHCTLPVEFAPAATGTFDATLTLTTNGGSDPTVALSGTGD